MQATVSGFHVRVNHSHDDSTLLLAADAESLASQLLAAAADVRRHAGEASAEPAAEAAPVAEAAPAQEPKPKPRRKTTAKKASK